jgi:hypothetical protein
MIDLGDGKGETSLPISPDRSFNFEVEYPTTGLYSIKVKVTDDDGDTGESFLPVRLEVDAEGNLYVLSWRNRRLNVDVDDSGEVVPLDVLLVINELQRSQNNDLASRIAEFDLNAPRYFDVSGDGFLSPIDVLQIINHLNRTSFEGEGTPEISREGEFGSAVPLMTIASPTAPIRLQASGENLSSQSRELKASFFASEFVPSKEFPVHPFLYPARKLDAIEEKALWELVLDDLSFEVAKAKGKIF